MKRKISVQPELAPIKDELKRRCAMTKRKRCLFKKAIELSSLCDIDVFFCIFDRNRQKIFELTTDEDFDIQIVSHMLNQVNRQQFCCKSYKNEDYDKFKENNRIDTFGDSVHNSEQSHAKKRSRKTQQKMKNLQSSDLCQPFSFEDQKKKYIRPQNQQKQYLERYKQAKLLAATQPRFFKIEKPESTGQANQLKIQGQKNIQNTGNPKQKIYYDVVEQTNNENQVDFLTEQADLYSKPKQNSTVNIQRPKSSIVKIPINQFESSHTSEKVNEHKPFYKHDIQLNQELDETWAKNQIFKPQIKPINVSEKISVNLNGKQEVKEDQFTKQSYYNNSFGWLNQPKKHKQTTDHPKVDEQKLTQHIRQSVDYKQVSLGSKESILPEPSIFQHAEKQNSLKMSILANQKEKDKNCDKIDQRDVFEKYDALQNFDPFKTLSQQHENS